MNGLRRYLALLLVPLLAVCLLGGCGSIKRKLGIGPKYALLRSLSISAEAGANLGNSTQLDIVVVYSSTAVARMPKTGPDWFRQREALRKELGKDVGIFSQEVDTPSASFTIKLPRVIRKKGLAVYAFANYAAPEGWPVIALTSYKKAALRMQPKSVALVEQ
jgi:type VI secretion system protein